MTVNRSLTLTPPAAHRRLCSPLDYPDTAGNQIIYRLYTSLYANVFVYIWICLCYYTKYLPSFHAWFSQVHWSLIFSPRSNFFISTYSCRCCVFFFTTFSPSLERKHSEHGSTRRARRCRSQTLCPGRCWGGTDAEQCGAQGRAFEVGLCFSGTPTWQVSH